MKTAHKGLKLAPKSISVRVGARKSVVPAGDYKARILKIERRPSVRDRDAFHFYFQIVEGPYSGEEVRGFVNANYEAFSEYTKLYQWYQAATGESPEAGEEMNFELFYRNVILVEVKDALSRRTKNAFSNVSLIKEVVHAL